MDLKYMGQFFFMFPIAHSVRNKPILNHYMAITKLKGEKARNFYVGECAKSNWSIQRLEQQSNSFYYRRLLSSRNKDDAGAERAGLEPGEKVIHAHYVLKFPGMEQPDVLDEHCRYEERRVIL